MRSCLSSTTYCWRVTWRSFDRLSNVVASQPLADEFRPARCSRIPWSSSVKLGTPHFGESVAIH